MNDNYGSGAVASTAISGAQYGIGAYANSGGTGDVTVNVGANATISTSTGSNGLFGIQAFSLDAGNITVLMSAGDVVTSGSVGVVAVSQAATEPASSTITVTAAGTINSGPNTQDGGYPSGGIQAGYFPNNSQTLDANVQGSVSVTSDATITAAGGWGIEAFNFGTGNAAITTEADSSITNNGSSITTSVGTFAAVGIAAYAFDGGDASISNAATVYAATGIGLQAQATGGNGSGTVTITNDGKVSGDGTSANPVVQITTDTGAATLTNESGGTIAPVSSSASGLAISETGGPFTIYNYGTIIGDVALANTTFTNESGGVWDVSGVNTFGSGSNTIDNMGVINAVGGTTTLDVPLDNTGSVDVQAGTLDLSGAVTGSGSFTIGNGATLEFGSSVAAGATVLFAGFAGSSGTFILEQPSSFAGQMGGLVVGDSIDLVLPTGVTVTSAVINGSVLDVTESNGSQLSYNIAAFTGSFSNDYFAIQNTASGSDLVLTAILQINWQGTSGGNWTNAIDWSGGVVPNSDNAANITASGTYEVVISSPDVAYSLVLNDAGATVAINSGGTLTLSGPLTVAAGTVELNNGGTIFGGTLALTGGKFDWVGGTLSGVTYDGTMDLSPSNSTVFIANGLTANNQAGAAPGTINLTGVSDSIYFEGNQTFNNATINLGSTLGYYDNIYNYDTNNTGSVLTLGLNVIVNQAVNETSGYAELISAGSNHTGDGIVNQGTINAQAVNGSFYIEPYNFTNQGTINVSNGDKLYIEPSVGLTNAATGDISISSAGSIFDFSGGSGATTNAGTITMAAGTTLTLGSSTSALSNTGLISGTDDTVDIYSFSNTGTFNITNSTVNLYGSYTTAQLAVFDNQSDTVTIDGTLTNTGSTLTVGLGAALGKVVLASGGTIVGGTIVDQGSGVLFQSGTLSGVTYDGTMDLSPNNSTVYIANGLTANNQAGAAPGTINLTGVSDSIYFEGNQTFNNATINLGSTLGYYDNIYNYDTNNTGSVLTLGLNVIVNQAVNETSGYAELISAGSNHTGDGIVNQGTINAQAVNGSFYIEPYNFTNQGTINVSNGDKLYIEPSVGLTNAATGDISISSAGSILDFSGGSGATTNAGTITMAAGTTLTLGSSTSALSNTGLISGTDDTVNIYSFGSFANTGTFNITNSTVNLYGSYTTAQLAVFDNQGDTVTIDGTLTNTGSTLTVGLGAALGKVVLASGGTIVGGTIVDQGSGVLFQSGTLSGVTYDGTMDLSPNNSTVYIANGLTANNQAGAAPGTINLTGVRRQHLFRGQPDLQQCDHQSRQHVGILR